MYRLIVAVTLPATHIQANCSFLLRGSKQEWPRDNNQDKLTVSWRNPSRLYNGSAEREWSVNVMHFVNMQTWFLKHIFHSCQVGVPKCVHECSGCCRRNHVCKISRGIFRVFVDKLILFCRGTSLAKCFICAEKLFYILLRWVTKISVVLLIVARVLDRRLPVIKPYPLIRISGVIEEIYDNLLTKICS